MNEMSTIFDLFSRTLLAAYDVVAEAGWYILAGLVISGLIRTFLRAEQLARFLGRRSISSVLWAAAIGVPLPLCSCSVIPVASGLKKGGASDAAVTAFLIATPENGADSIAISWGLLGPLMTIARVVASLFTAITAGFAMLFFGRKEQHALENGRSPALSCCGPKPIAAKPPCCSEKSAISAPEAIPESPAPVRSCCAAKTATPPAVAPSEPHSCCPPKPDQPTPGIPISSAPISLSLPSRLVAGQRYAFGDLFASIASYYFWGLLATGVITALLPAGFIETHAGGGLASMLVMLAIGIPLYVCASASTPMVAALIAKGMSPGAALVFVLAGPATNMATIAVVRGLMGMRAAAIYLGSIAICSLAMGLALDALLARWGLHVTTALQAHIHGGGGLWPHLGAVLFLGLLAWTLARPLLGRLRAR